MNENTNKTNLADLGVNVNLTWNVAFVLIVSCLSIFAGYFLCKKFIK